MIGNPEPDSTMYKDKGYHIMNREEERACFWGKQLHRARNQKRQWWDKKAKWSDKKWRSMNKDFAHRIFFSETSNIIYWFYPTAEI